MRDYFYGIADSLSGLLEGGEEFICSFAAETSDFVRFNRAKIRQAGRVEQRSLNLDLIAGRRHAAAELTLAGDPKQDRPRLVRLVEELREIRAYAPEDPYLHYATEVQSSEQLHPDGLPTGMDMAAQILAAARGYDLVGIHASGATHAGFANSLGQRNWYTRHSFNLDWSLYLDARKAVKAQYAGFGWDENELQARVGRAGEQLEALARPARELKPGRYRVYLTPAAFNEIIDLLGWGGFGLRAHRTRTTPLLRMAEAGACLHPGLSMVENTADGVAPSFDSAGFIRPPRVALIEQGAYRDCLVSARSAAEYGVAGNGANAFESPLSIDVAPGTLVATEALQALDSGLYVGNLWYLNYSDRSAARLTGMTRFATFWVENGRIQAPVEAMRFDESLYRLLGDALLGLTREREMLLDPDTYGARSKSSARLPGLLAGEMHFTL